MVKCGQRTPEERRCQDFKRGFVAVRTSTTRQEDSLCHASSKGQVINDNTFSHVH